VTEPGPTPAPDQWSGPRHRARRRRPPWWPEGEPWPPAGPPWGRGGRHIRRRVAIAATFVVLVLVGIGIAIGSAVSSGGGDHRGGWRGPPFAPLVFVVVIILIAIAIASRRIARPVRRLLVSAERIGAGDYDARVTPEGPFEVRRLMQTFNTMAARLETTDTERRRFLADVTHELRTPLAILQSGIEAQLDGVHPRDDAHLTSLLEEAHRLGGLVDDLHTLALLGANKLPLHREGTEPAALVEDAVAAAAARAAEKQLTVDIDVAGGLPVLDIDPRRIRQVLDNLLANALRYTPAGARITVSARAEPATDRVVFAVRDTGPGIPPERLRRVFERFETSDDRTGSGLGLAIARDLVQAHGGTVDIASSPAGTTVTFALPRTPTPPTR
jgi:signal transduction histidine kinase